MEPRVKVEVGAAELTGEQRRGQVIGTSRMLSRLRITPARMCWTAHVKRAALLNAALGLFCLNTVTIAPALAQDNARPCDTVKADGTISVRAFELPMSSFLTSEARVALLRRLAPGESASRPCASPRDSLEWIRTLHTYERLVAARNCWDERISAPLAARHRERHDVRIQPDTIAGVYTQVITPAAGVSPENRNRVLINLHGGGFISGAIHNGQIESIPVAAIGMIKVVSVDYRLAPEHVFPAASEDVAAVYRQLLQSYKPENIGIYGCSAGGLLTAQAVSWFQKEELPLPGAVGMFCAAAASFYEGDSLYIVGAISNVSFERLQDHPYLKHADPNDALAFPVTAPQVLAKFPPSLLITATRDTGLSNVVHTHAELVRRGVEADLHVWDGLGHGFFYDPDLPESRDVYAVIVKFFDRHLGKH